MVVVGKNNLTFLQTHRAIVPIHPHTHTVSLSLSLPHTYTPPPSSPTPPTHLPMHTHTYQYLCSSCGGKRDAVKGLKLKRLPYLLALQLKRFDYDFATFHRIKVGAGVCGLACGAVVDFSVSCGSVVCGGFGVPGWLGVVVCVDMWVGVALFLRITVGGVVDSSVGRPPPSPFF
jgi:hypothetical protein